MIIDTHAHLTDGKFENVAEIIEESIKAGVGRIIVPTVDIDDLNKAIKLAEGNKNIYVLGGIHPETVIANFNILNNTNSYINELEKAIKSSPKVIGIGEVGLDFYQDKSKRTVKKQIEFFTAQLNLAEKLNLPVVIHLREADWEVKEVLENRSRMPHGQFHCFGGSVDTLRLILDLGFYVSFAGNITFKSADNLRGLLKMVPLNRLLLETDCPLLAPEPVRGSTNMPKNVKILAEYQAKLLDISYEKLTEETSNNAKCLFSAI